MGRVRFTPVRPDPSQGFKRIAVHIAFPGGLGLEVGLQTLGGVTHKHSTLENKFTP
jgi:hypothetical protein